MTKEYSCVKRTKKAFEMSLTELSKEYPLNKITVKLLCEKAQMSRNAFYFHYDDINALVRAIEDDIVNEITGYLADFKKLGFPENISATITALVDLFDEERDKVLMLFDKAYSVSFTRRLSKIFSDFNLEYYRRFHPGKEKSVGYTLFYAFLSNGFYESLRVWLEKPEEISKEDVKRITFMMIKRLLIPHDPSIEDIVR